MGSPCTGRGRFEGAEIESERGNYREREDREKVWVEGDGRGVGDGCRNMGCRDGAWTRDRGEDEVGNRKKEWFWAGSLYALVLISLV